jgi:hypothetical protein
MPSFRPCCCKNRPNARGISPCIIVWCWDTPRAKVCNGYTATRFLRSRFTAVTAWTSSWFGRRVSTMEHSWCRQIQFGMQGFCSFSLPHRKPTPVWKRLSVHSCRRWKHMTILRMVVVSIISLILFMWIILLYLLKHFRLAGICRFLGPVQARPQETYSLCHSHLNYPGKTAGRSCRWHRNHSAPPAQSFRGSARWPPGGVWGRMQDVVCQLVGIGLVPRYVMKAIGLEGTMGCMELQLYHLWLLYSLFQFVWHNQFNWYNLYE